MLVVREFIKEFFWEPLKLLLIEGCIELINTF